MVLTIPYVRRPDDGPNEALVRALAAAFATGDPDAIEVRPIEDLGADERGRARVAIVDGPSAAQLATLPALEWVHSTWAGVEQLVEMVPADVRVVRMIDPQLTHTMAEAVLAWTLFLHRDMPRYAAQQRRGEWRDHPLVRTSDRRVGVLGLGELGAAAAQRLAANGFDVAGWSRTPRSIDGVRSTSGGAGLDELLERSDIVVNLLPDTEQTRGLLGAVALGRLPQGASILNVGRGPTIDDDALLEALDDGRLAHAVLDVFDVEPLPEAHPFWRHPSVTVLPHITGPTSPDTAAVVVAANVRHWLATGELPGDALVDRSRGY